MQATSISLQDQELTHIRKSSSRKLRGRRIGLIFQDPMSSLNPVATMGEQIAEVLELHFQLAKPLIKQRILELLRQVEIPEPERRIMNISSIVGRPASACMMRLRWPANRIC